MKKKIQNMSIEDINIEMKKIKLKVASEYGWLHKNRRYIALSNEKEIRSGFITNKKLLKRLLQRKS